jgi:two-component sensor histidine kinase
MASETPAADTILILAPIGRDAPVAASILARAGIASTLCSDLAQLVSRLDEACSAIIAEEALLRSDRRALAEWIEAQPPWSDFPFILLAQRGGVSNPQLVELLGNVTPLERPFHPSTLVSAARAAVRVRKRQREAESYLEERRRTEHRQRLLIRELHHRVKNTLATVQAVVGSTARSAGSEEFYRAFTGRIVSLANTHTLLTEAFWQTASLRELLEKELGPYMDDAGERVLLDGPTVDLPSQIAVPLGMAVHELTTNAAKFGALSTVSGRVRIAWNVERGAEGRVLHLDWVEMGGPEVRPPQRRGFGSQLIERVLKVQLEAQVQADFAPAGLRLRLAAPLPESVGSERPANSEMTSPQRRDELLAASGAFR